jgi:hypothetical protein
VDDRGDQVEKFVGTLVLEEDGGAFIEVPFDVKERYGRARQPVTASLNGYRFETTIATYGGRYYVGVRKQVRAAAGIERGDTVQVELEPR